jgi:uncharacterized membrane protein YozB (DUF420 family)
MRLALPFLLLCCALVAAVLVLGWASHAPDLGLPPDLTLRDPAGHRFELAAMRGRVWVASFVSAQCLEDCPSAVERLAGLHDGLPRGVPLVTFVVEVRGLWPPRPTAAQDRPGWVICQGNAADADAEEEVERLATDYLHVPPELLAGLARAEPASVVVPVDRRGRVRRVYALSEPPGGRADPGVASAWGDVEFLTELHRHPLRDATLYGLVALFLLGGVACARLGLLRVHPLFTIGGAVLTIGLVGSTFHYVDAAASVPFRGTGWWRPLYLAVMGIHGVVSAAMVALGLTLVYHAVRRQNPRHRALARWVAPAWIAAAVTGSIVYGLLHLWFGAD